MTPRTELPWWTSRFSSSATTAPKEVPIEEREAEIKAGRTIGEVNLIPRKADHLDELEEVSPEEYDALILEIGPKTTTLTAKELVKLIDALNEVYEGLPVEIRDKLRTRGARSP